MNLLIRMERHRVSLTIFKVSDKSEFPDTYLRANDLPAVLRYALEYFDSK